VREGAATDPANTTETEVDIYPIEETTYEIVLHDSQSAARHLARILHLEVNNRPPEARRPTDDGLEHRMADLLERARARGRREGAAGIQPPPQTMELHSECAHTATPQPSEPVMTSPITTVEVTQGCPNSIKAQDNLILRKTPSPSPSAAGSTARNGLWNRLFKSAPVLTFINQFESPFGSNDYFHLGLRHGGSH
jgi:hypothetical protein